MSLITKNIKTCKHLLLKAVAIMLISAVPAAKNNYILSKDYAVTINGTSNLHSWDEKVETVTGNGIVNPNSDGSFDLEAINIKMEVHSIKSDMGSIMNNNTYKALKADANPEIVFALTAPVKAIQSKASEKTVSAKGNLTIAGVTKQVDIQIKLSIQDKGKLSFEGKQIIKMTDYGVEPPVALFGTLKTGNEITINFKTNFTITNN